MRWTFTKPTLYFLIAGIFLPPITAISLLLIQILLTSLGIECSVAWNTIFWISKASVIIFPILFFIFSKSKLKKAKSIALDITIFNFVEFLLVQSSLALFLEDAKTLCYSSDGQIGLGLVLVGWAAIPILLLLSIIFDQLNEVF